MSIDDNVLKEIINANLTTDPILKFFSWEHLRDEALRETSRQFTITACFILENVPRNAERTVALRKLLEAKDAAVRAKLP